MAEGASREERKRILQSPNAPFFFINSLPGQIRWIEDVGDCFGARLVGFFSLLPSPSPTFSSKKCKVATVSEEKADLRREE
ncbi:hypothetical protein NQZ68_018937 [Dissostichus eleginoides]|nr:hypothetical protein NQZ68_018937 [Dissostichus eleginoides]